MEQVFGDTWQRAGLDRKARSIVTIAVLVASRQPAELKNHVRIGLNNGLSTTELEEVVLQCQPYLGWPAAGSAMVAIMEVLRERNMLGDAKTPEDRGLL